MVLLNKDQLESTLRSLERDIRSIALIESKDPITLSNGQKSHFYFDMRKIIGDPQFHMNLISVLFAKYHRMKLRSVGGIESGSIPIAYLYSAYSTVDDIPVSAFYIRKKARDHGTQQWVEGAVSSPCIIFEDVVTTGQSVIRAVNAFRKSYPSVEILGICAVVDRTGDGCLDIRRYTGLQVSSLFKYRDFI